MAPGRRWTVRDRKGDEVYLTDERWEHIVEGHPEMLSHEAELRETVRWGRRAQEPLAPQKFRYSKRSAGLPEGNTHLVAIVLFRYGEDEEGMPVPNNYIVTAYQKQVE
ncbi:MAG: hypothetical protein H0W11_04080 [Gemmatimonadetes bacterium]|jgi:hypothetical protein|nr:hypothetical protein [Gemmatimonadota bacterium]MBA4158242.1 hypothetical protein [Gemmatimonadota bacterium]